MDCSLSYTKPSFPTLPAAGVISRPITFGLPIRRRPLILAASTTNKCAFGGLNAPLEPRTPAGKFLSGVLLDDRDSFQGTARKELERLAADREDAVARFQLSLGSDEACLHRRIADCRSHECQEAVEDIMYMLIFYKFSDMGVNLVPRLSKCLYNGRVEIWPSKDWELESIHSVEVLEMVREHITAIVGCKANANVTDSWATTSVQRRSLCKMYAASILYGYFLKNVSLRYQLERDLDMFGMGVLGQGQHPVSEIFSAGSEYIACGQVGRARLGSVGQVSYSLGANLENLRFYVMGFDNETIQMCAKPKTREAVNLVGRHSCALFGDNETDDVITTSFASLKRFLLEAVAFGSFLWDAENSINDVYMLGENQVNP